MRRRYLTVRAVLLMKRGEPLPLDLFAELLSEGVNVDELDRRFRA
jgi:hypothetical protein